MAYKDIIKTQANKSLGGGEALTTTTTTTPMPWTAYAKSPLEASGLSIGHNYLAPIPNFLSNGLTSYQSIWASGITDFTLFNPYIHYHNKGGSDIETPSTTWTEINAGNAITIQPSSLLIESQIRFEIYIQQFRQPDYYNSSRTFGER